jgi:LuxR family maltose regulon positive regulatory protein
VSESLLQTKLYVPQIRPNLVPRPRLIERLNQGLQLGHKLTLVSAPAGFGKTTLVSEWVASAERPAAWLSLDEGDNDPTRFLAYLVAALQTLVLSDVEGIEANFGVGVLGMLQSPQPPPTESILTALLNEITTIPDNFVLVLDNYHEIDAKPVDDALTFLLEHLPPQMHLIIATREDPHLPLARLRVRGQLTEMRATDLRFNPGEAATFLNLVMGLGFSKEEVATLEEHTEGWIDGLLEGWPVLPLAVWVFILTLVGINTALAYMLCNHALRSLTALEMNMLLNLSQLVTAVFAWLLLRETLSKLQVV